MFNNNLLICNSAGHIMYGVQEIIENRKWMTQNGVKSLKMEHLIGYIFLKLAL